MFRDIVFPKKWAEMSQEEQADWIKQHYLPKSKTGMVTANSDESSFKPIKPLADVPEEVWGQITGAIPPPQVGFGGARHRNDALRYSAGIAYRMQGHSEEALIHRLMRDLSLSWRKMKEYLLDLQRTYSLVKINDGRVEWVEPEESSLTRRESQP